MKKKKKTTQSQETQAVFVKNEDTTGNYQVMQSEKLDIVLGEMKFPSEAGEFQLKATYFLNDDLNEYQENLIIHHVSLLNGVRDLRILPYTVKVVGVDQKYNAEILIVNDSDRDVYERVRGFIFEIVKENATLYRYTKYEDREINIYIPAYSKKTLFDSSQWREIRFQEPGKCNMKVRIILENGVLEYSEEIVVEK